MIERQLSNVQESYNSLLYTAQQIRGRLCDSLAKFQQYEDTLESIMCSLDECEPLVTCSVEDNLSLAVAQGQLEQARVSIIYKLGSKRCDSVQVSTSCVFTSSPYLQTMNGENINIHRYDKSMLSFFNGKMEMSVSRSLEPKSWSASLLRLVFLTCVDPNHK